MVITEGTVTGDCIIGPQVKDEHFNRLREPAHLVYHTAHMKPATQLLPPPRWHRLRPLMYGLLAVFAGWCIHLFSHDLAQMPAIDVDRYAGAIALCGGLSLVNYGLRIVRWQAFLSRLGHDFTVLRSSLYYVAGFAFTLSPGKVGELARVRYYQAHGVPGATVTAAFFVERLLDLLAVLGMALLIFTQVLAGDSYQPLLILTTVLLIGIALMLAWVPWDKLGQKHPLLNKVAQTLTQARALLSPGLLLWAILLSALAWGSEGIGLAVLIDVIPGHDITTATASGIYAIAVLAGALSFMPGGLGGTEAVMAALLHQHGLTLGEAVLITLLCRLLTLWFAVLLGWLAIFILKFSHD